MSNLFCNVETWNWLKLTPKMVGGDQSWFSRHESIMIIVTGCSGVGQDGSE